MNPLHPATPGGMGGASAASATADDALLVVVVDLADAESLTRAPFTSDTARSATTWKVPHGFQ